METRASMSTPRGMKCVTRTMSTGDRILLYSNAEQLVLQMRRNVATEEELLAPSFKVAVSLSTPDAVWLAGELLTAVLPHLLPVEETHTATVQQSVIAVSTENNS